MEVMAETVEDSEIRTAGGPEISYQVIDTEGTDQQYLRFNSNGILEIRLADTSIDIDKLLSEHEQWIENQYSVNRKQLMQSRTIMLVSKLALCCGDTHLNMGH